MLKYIKNEIEVNKSFYKSILLSMVILYMAIECIVTIAILSIHSDTYMNFGVLVPFIFVGIFVVSFIGINFYSGFENAVKMSINCRDYIISTLISTLISLIEFCIIIKFINLIDTIYVSIVFKNIVYNKDFLKWFDIKYMIGLLYIVFSLSIFISAMIHKFGKPLVMTFLYTYLIIMVLSIYRDSGIGFINIVFIFFVNLKYNMLIIFFVCTILLMSAIAVMNKESIKT